MKVTLLKYPTADDWMEVKRAAFVTAGLEAKTPPSEEWKHRMLVARHSPIRELQIKFLLEDVPTWVATHLVRHHEGFQPYVRSQRNDRQSDYDRTKAPQDAPVDMIVSLNAEAMMVLANKRLCMQASTETRELVRVMCRTLIERCPEFSGVLVPMCRYHGGVCHEMKPCHMFPYDGMEMWRV